MEYFQLKLKRMILPKRLLAIALKRHGVEQLYNAYQNSLLKRVNCRLRITYINKCLQADIIPRFLKFRVPENGCFDPQMVDNFQRNLLKAELSKAKQLMETHNNNIMDKRNSLKESLPDALIPSVVVFSRLAMAEAAKNVQKRHDNKLNNLSIQQQRPLFDVHDTVKVIGVNHPIPAYVLDTLALGPKNATVDQFDPKQVLTEIDSLLYRCKRDKVSGDVMNRSSYNTEVLPPANFKRV